LHVRRRRYRPRSSIIQAGPLWYATRLRVRVRVRVRVWVRVRARVRVMTEVEKRWLKSSCFSTLRLSARRRE